MDTISYTYIEPTSEVLNVLSGITYECPHCDYINLIQSKDEVYGTLVQRVPDKHTLDLVFGHECTHCRSEVTISHYLPHAFRVWMRQDDSGLQ